MYKLNGKTKEMASLTLGMDFESFINLDYDEEMAYINRFNGKRCTFVPETSRRFVECDNPLLARCEYLTMDEVNKGLDKVGDI